MAALTRMYALGQALMTLLAPSEGAAEPVQGEGRDANGDQNAHPRAIRRGLLAACAHAGAGA